MIALGVVLAALVVVFLFVKRRRGVAATVVRQARPGRVGHRRRGETL